MRRKTIEDCIKIAKERGGRCLSTEYKNGKTKLKWQCDNGHVFFATYSDVCYKGSWCSECRNIKSALRIEEYNKRKKNEIINKIEKIAENNNGKLLSNKNDYQCALGKLLWECQNRHQFWSSWLQVGTMEQWCPVCFFNTKRKTYEDVKRLVEKRGTLLSSKYNNNKEKLLIECVNKHKFPMSYGDVKRGHWCPKCVGLDRNTIDDAVRLAETNNGKCLSKEYVNSGTKMLWECEKKHRWETKYSCIRNGTWCPVCRGSKMQKKIYHIIKDVFGTEVKYNYRGFEWLKNIRKMELDIYVPKLKLAIEYDGMQHYEPVNFGGISNKQALVRLKKQKDVDRLKNRKIKNYPEDVKYFIRFNYKENITKEYVIEKIRNIGVSV